MDAARVRARGSTASFIAESMAALILLSLAAVRPDPRGDPDAEGTAAGYRQGSGLERVARAQGGVGSAALGMLQELGGGSRPCWSASGALGVLWALAKCGPEARDLCLCCAGLARRRVGPARQRGPRPERAHYDGESAATASPGGSLVSFLSPHAHGPKHSKVFKHQKFQSTF